MVCMPVPAVYDDRSGIYSFHFSPECVEEGEQLCGLGRYAFVGPGREVQLSHWVHHAYLME